ncbi:MOSC-domain-containing protein [Aaosphaeria arxii CBS 175.79]|uniref:MOSC-domain-containing protein n=1 Tax=Aaosphaeria arxii CBS 175.79 TaxID=1450172 RepID=A0A6A5Y6S3_9PLEO|nr:MOSC-domain-containing protein [Aaosphaeria arxii CBS 175.79]KAF2020923.1 MOSC-domain-containing protein [Aaosphaeria arxii CBS 175.79]
MASSSTTQGAIVLSVFFLPILTYFLYIRLTTQAQSKSLNTKPQRDVGPLPAPTKITQLLIHPIKSCHGISVPSAKLLPTGLDLDRQWMWVSYPDYKFLTIRNLSKMTLIRPTYDSSTDTLTITAPAPNSMDEKLQFSIPAHPSASWLASNTSLVDATVWSAVTPAHCYSAELTNQFNDFFGREVRLVYKSPYSDVPRPLVSNGAPKVLGRNASTCFPDLMPILVGTEASIDELNTRLQAAEGLTIPVTRFRPNILVKGDATKPWDEDRWKTLRITSSAEKDGELVLDITQRCARCQVPNVDTESGEKNPRQPWDTLMKYRRIDEGITFKPCFGMLCVPRGEGMEIRVGDTLEVTEVTGDHRYLAGM